MKENFQTLSLKNICKNFPGVCANSDITIDFKASEVHALLGENGAGKTTLMNIIYGIYNQDKGDILINNKRINIRSPKDAISSGIGMVHQHFMLVQNHTVCENILLGYKQAPFFYPQKKFKNKIKEYSDKFNLHINPDAKIWELSAGEQQRVEILKALIRNIKLLILDEPTSVLTPNETSDLFKTIKNLVQSGLGVIFISHKLDEVFAISDQITVLRNGKVVGSVVPGDTSKNELARMMVGREIVSTYEKKQKKEGKVALSVDDLWVKSDRDTFAVKGISFKINRGEILGIAGVSGNGQRQLVEVITGLRKPCKGKIEIFNHDISHKNAKEIFRLKVGHIPEERLVFGCVPNLSIMENSILKEYDSPSFCKNMILNFEKIQNHTRKLIEDFSITTVSINNPIKLLSGGNIQKFICAREFSSKPELLIAAHPTYGLDIAATDYIRRLFLKKRDEGCSILLVSEDLEEILTISDRVLVMFNGTISGIFIPGEISMEKIGLMMAGSTSS
ncbi:MAG: ABC transporter ATP-binding protein [Spirochaetes bacterium]|nr:ABC transporter ATP-binding protein [Spirochaetota bacterium]